MSSRARLSWTDPTLPPLFEGRCVLPGEQPFAEALRGAARDELRAGDALWSQNPDRAELAIVLEPDQPLKIASQVLHLGVVAAGDCLGVLTPPQVGVFFRWPGTLLLNGAAAGEITLAASTNDPDAIPDWMVLDFTLQLHHTATSEPGATPNTTALAEEGGEALTTSSVIETFSRHFLSWLDTWQSDGLAPVNSEWTSRAEGRDASTEIMHANSAISARVLGLDEDGNLLIKDQTGPAKSLPLLDCLAAAKATTESLKHAPDTRA